MRDIGQLALRFRDGQSFDGPVWRVRYWGVAGLRIEAMRLPQTVRRR